MRKQDGKLKILFLPAWYPREENRVDGIFIREHAQAVALYNDVTVLYNEGLGKDVNGLYKIASDKIEEGIRTIRIRHRKSPIPKTSYFFYLWSLFMGFKYLIREGWQPHIIQAHIFTAGVPAIILGKIYKVPVVITEHSSVFPRHMLGRVGILKARFVMRRAQIVLPVSQDLKESIESYGIKNRFQIIPNAANTEMFHPSHVQHEKDKKRILLVALLSPIKGIPYLLYALAGLKEKRQDFILDIVGDGPSRKEYENLTEELELITMVRFHGMKSKQEVAAYMRQCDFFILPSLWENLPCVLIEAMATGVPVIATNIGGVKEIINENVGLLIPPKNMRALEKAIEYMLDTCKNYSAEEIARYAREKFSYAEISRKLDKIYREILVR